jgi:hypothetical protein
MESKRTSNKSVVKTGGRKKNISKCVNEVIDNLCGEPSVEDSAHGSVKGSLIESGRRLGISKVEGFYPFIHPDFHAVLDDIPLNRIDDLEYVHYHIFTIWFCSKMGVSIPKDMNLRFEVFNHFPFFATLFHLQNNLA